MPRTKLAILLRIVGLSILSIVLILLFCMNLEQIPFDPDESWFIASSGVFETLVTGDVMSQFWRENAVTLSHPPGVRYLVAMGRLVGGYGRDDLNQLYDYKQSLVVNQAQGRVPSLGLLWWSRLPMALIGAACGLLLVFVAYEVAGMLAAVFALLLYAANTYVRNNVGHAMGEAPLFCCLLLATLVGFRAINIWESIAQTEGAGLRQLRPVGGWFVLMGICCGFAGLIKINGLLVVSTVIVACVLLTYAATGKVQPLVRSPFVLRTGAATVAGTLGVFVLFNPYLYPDILGRTAGMFLYRAAEMRYQQQIFPNHVLPGIGARLTWSWWQITSDNAAISFPGAWLLNTTLLLCGLWQLLSATWNSLITRRGLGYSGLLLLVLLASGGPMVVLNPFDWPRYAFLPVVWGGLCIAVGAAAVLESIIRTVRVGRMEDKHVPGA